MKFVLKDKLQDSETPNQLRKAGLLPGIVYGPEFAPTRVALSYRDFAHVFKKAGESQVVYLEVKGKEEPVLVHDVALDPLSDAFLHVDFYRFKKGSKVETVIPLEFQGVAPGVKDKGGVLFTELREVEVEALPEKLVSFIPVDLSILAEIGDEIAVKDVKTPEGVEITLDPDTVVVRVTEPTSILEEATIAAASEEGETPAEEGESPEGEKSQQGS